MTIEAFIIDRGREDWSAEEEESYREFLRTEEEAVREEVKANDLVAVACTYVCFVSCSNGRGRKPRPPRQVEIIGYNGKFYSVRDGKGPFDEIATEVLGDAVDPKEVEKIFLERVRRL